MKTRTWPILVLGFGALIGLVGFLGIDARARAEHIYAELRTIHETYRRSAAVLNEVHTDLFLSGILVRDYLLDPSEAAGTRHRQNLLDIRSSTSKHLESLETLIGVEEGEPLGRLRAELDAYWDSLDPIFGWSPGERFAARSRFLRREVIPRRESVLSITQEIDRLTAASFEREEQKANRSLAGFRTYLRGVSISAVLVAVLVAVVSIARMSRLERRSEEQHVETEKAERELRNLSQQLVQTQEQERTTISRELHDEVGQVLTALRMELGNVERLRDARDARFEEHVAEAKSLTERALRAARSLAAGLRPSILDDLGLEPALQAQAREFFRHSGIPVTVRADGELSELPEAVRTCIYRVVQESLTNCARHARAASIEISLAGGVDRVSLTVRDDGVGFAPHAVSGRGIGLVGMEERARKLGGRLTVSSLPRRGTTVSLELPVKEGSHA